MWTLIERLIRCGVPVKTAFCVVEDFALAGQTNALIRYIEVEEAENGVARVQ